VVARSLPTVFGCLLGVSLGCSDDRVSSTVGDTAGGSGGSNDANGSSTDEESSSSTDEDGSTSDTNTTESESKSESETEFETDTEDGSIFDIGTFADIGEHTGCEAVDFLFVLDDSSSMSEHQQNLADNVPAFVDGLEATLEHVDSIQVGVVATDPYSYNPGPCILLGALVTETEGGGPNSSDAICGPYAEGFNYMTGVDDLTETFGCAALLGTMGNGFERPMEAMVTTLGKSLDVPGGCNEGFLRDDALLVIVVITDEYDGPGDPEAENPARDPPTSLGTPQTWYDAVVAAKGGIPQNAVALVITNYDDGPCPPSDLGHDGVNLVEWVEQFGDNGFLGGICEPDYGPIFAEATEVIETACDNFVPAD
jgi:hypothetical protein